MGPEASWGEIRHVVGLGHRRYLLQLADAPRPRDVGHDEVRQVVLQHGQEFVPRMEAFAHADPHRHLVPHLLQGVVALGWDGLLEPVDVVGRQAPGEVYGCGHVEVAVGVDEYLDPGADLLTYRGDDVDGALGHLGADLAVQVQEALVLHLGPVRVQLEGPVARSRRSPWPRRRPPRACRAGPGECRARSCPAPRRREACTRAAPRALPLMSQSAMSIPLTIALTAPRVPTYVKWRNRVFQMSSICEGSWPTISSAASRMTPATTRFATSPG